MLKEIYKCTKYIFDRNYKLFDLEYVGMTSYQNDAANYFVNSFLSENIKYDSEETKKLYELLFSSDGIDKNLSFMFQNNNLKNLYDRAKTSLFFQKIEDFVSASFSSTGEEKRKEKSSSLMSEYLIFLLLLDGRNVFNLEEFYVKSKGGKNIAIPDFRLLFDDKRIAIQIKRNFSKDSSEVRTDFIFGDDLKITETNLITFIDEDNKTFNEGEYIRKTKLLLKKKNDKKITKTLIEIGMIRGIDWLEKTVDEERKEKIRKIERESNGEIKNDEVVIENVKGDIINIVKGYLNTNRNALIKLEKRKERDIE